MHKFQGNFGIWKVYSCNDICDKAVLGQSAILSQYQQHKFNVLQMWKTTNVLQHCLAPSLPELVFQTKIKGQK